MMAESELQKLYEQVGLWVQSNCVLFDQAQQQLTLEGGPGCCPLVMSLADQRVELLVGRERSTMVLAATSQGWHAALDIAIAVVGGHVSMFSKYNGLLRTESTETTYTFDSSSYDTNGKATKYPTKLGELWVASFAPYPAGEAERLPNGGTAEDDPECEELTSLAQRMRSSVGSGAVHLNFRSDTLMLDGGPGCCTLTIRALYDEVIVECSFDAGGYMAFDRTPEAWQAINSMADSIVSGTVVFVRSPKRRGVYKYGLHLFDGKHFDGAGNQIGGADDYTILVADFAPYSSNAKA